MIINIPPHSDVTYPFGGFGGRRKKEVSGVGDISYSRCDIRRMVVALAPDEAKL
jgi:hypothetical protein